MFASPSFNLRVSNIPFPFPTMSTFNAALSRTIWIRQPISFFTTMNLRDEDYDHVNRLFSIDNQHNLERRWVLADNSGYIHHVHYNEDLPDPRLIEGWMELRNFYRSLGDHDILIGYVGASAFQLTIFGSDTRKPTVNNYFDQLSTTKLRSEDYGHVDRLFAITFVVDLPAHWVIADNGGNVHHVHHNQDLHNPKFVEGWTQLRNFYWLLGDHDILLAYVGGSCFQLTVFISRLGKWLRRLLGKSGMRKHMCSTVT
ncbi:hypothetical protein ACSQ67_008871 [Phaseolus vulgaris]